MPFSRLKSYWIVCLPGARFNTPISHTRAFCPSMSKSNVPKEGKSTLLLSIVISHRDPDHARSKASEVSSDQPNETPIAESNAGNSHVPRESSVKSQSSWMFLSNEVV